MKLPIEDRPIITAGADDADNGMGEIIGEFRG
jgi:hypothetical protein